MSQADSKSYGCSAAAVAPPKAHTPVSTAATVYRIENMDCPTEEALIRSKLAQCRAEMEKGNSFAQAAYETKLLKPQYSRILLSGARSGRTDQALEQIRGLLEQSCSQTLSGVLSGAEPLLSGVMLLVAALSLVSVMLPLIGMMGTIG